MQYLKLRRTQVILVCFVLFAVLVVAFPVIDLRISGLFFDGRSFPQERWWQHLLHDGLNWFLYGSLGCVTALYAFNRVTRRHVAGIDGRTVLFLYLVLAIGGGLIVNVALKDHFGRARPRNITEFNGTKMFTPAFVPSHECEANCSFSSGDAAGGFFALALAMALSRRRGWMLLAVATGVVVSVGRISSGAHFCSDTVTSFFVMLLVADLLHYLLLRPRAPPDAPIATENK